MSLNLVSVYRGCDRGLWRVVWQPINREAIMHARRVLSESEHGSRSKSKSTSTGTNSKVIKKSKPVNTYYTKWSRGTLDGQATP